MSTPIKRESRPVRRHPQSFTRTYEFNSNFTILSNPPIERSLPLWWYAVMILGVFLAGSVDSIVSLILKPLGV